MTEQVDARPGGRLEALLVALSFGVVALFMAYLGARSWLPELASRHGGEIDRMLMFLLITTGGMAILGHLVLAFLIWRFSGAPKVSLRMASPRAERTWSIVIGLLMTLIAEGGVLAIGLPVWDEYYASPPPEDALVIEVTAEQFAWNVRYPGPDGKFGRTDRTLIDATNALGLDRGDPAAADDVVRVNRIYLPVNRPARVRLRSKDVIHSFFVPAFRVKQDAVPGMTIDLWFVPNREGQYELACTELCGLAHYYMKGLVDVLPPDEFEAWLQEATQEALQGG